MEAELQSQREHEQNHTKLGKRPNDLRVGNERDPDVGTDYHPGEEIAEDYGLMEALEHHRRHRRDA